MKVFTAWFSTNLKKGEKINTKNVSISTLEDMNTYLLIPYFLEEMLIFSHKSAMKSLIKNIRIRIKLLQFNINKYTNLKDTSTITIRKLV